MTIVVRGGRVVGTGAEATLADVVITEGRIAAVVAPGSADISGAEVVDAGDLLVLPGAVDPHVHFDEPGRVEWEGFDTGSAAAAAGGVTTVVDMPLDSDPPTTTAARVRAKADAARRSSRVDVAMWGGLVPGAVSHMTAMADAGVVGFKAFACPSGWDDFPPVDEATLAAGLEVAAGLGLPIAVHCELGHLGHTLASELEAVSWAASLAAARGARLHVVHASSAAAVDEAHRWPGVTVETCPHYLLLDEVEAAALGPVALCAPPMRDAANRDALWQRLLGGDIDCIASDHSPCPPSAKTGPHPWAGITGVETGVAALLSDGRLDPVATARLLTAAARLLGLPGKGAIAPGYDADIVLVDLDRPWTVTADRLWNRHRQSPFTGRAFTARVVRTLARGRTVFDLDHGVCDPGGGQVLRPA